VTVEILTPPSHAEWLELRHDTVGASEAPAILGVHPYMTPYQLWAKKSGLVGPDADNKQMRRGRLLEPLGIELLRAERPGWAIAANPIPGGKFYRDLEAGLSCTPDTEILDSARDGMGVCNIKTVNVHTFKSEWVIDGDIQLPVYVAIQVMQEMYLTGASWGCVLAVVGFDLDACIIDVEIHNGVMMRIKRAAQDFLRRVRENDPPPPNYARDGATIAALYDEDDGGEVDLIGNARAVQLVERREQAKNIESNGAEAAKMRKVIDSELIDILGNAARGILGDGRVIEAKTIRRAAYTVEPTSYRAVKIKTPKRTAA
jgi:putative phage-type endonuclease